MHDMVESTKVHYQEVICTMCRLKKQEWFVDDKGKDMSYKCTYEHPQDLPDLIMTTGYDISVPEIYNVR